ncbi:MAG: hypothetical protein OWT28_08690 [Firmicutes bacterium]|nr:hypothetical protein [Bacillota bacterium]
MSIAESIIAVWIFSLLTVLVYASSQSEALLLVRTAAHEQGTALGQGTLQRDGRLLAQGKAVLGAGVVTISGQPFLVSGQTVRVATYLRKVTVTVRTTTLRPPLILSLSTLQAVYGQ